MGLERTATLFLDDIPRTISRAYNGPSPSTWVDRLGPLYRAIVPSWLRSKILTTNTMQNVYPNAYLDQLKGRRFFELAANHATGGVRINLKGRERYGIVAARP